MQQNISAVSPKGKEESFAELFAEFENSRKVSEGSSIEVLVRKVDGNRVHVAAGLKADCEIPIEEFRAADGMISVQEGDYVTVKIELLDDGRGHTRLSYLQHLREQAWRDIQQAYEEQKPIEGHVQERVKGGYSVHVNGLRCFLPGSLVDIFPIADPSELCGKTERFLIKRIYDDRQSAILNRRSLREHELVGNDMSKIVFKEGDVVKGTVAAIAEYPESTAFVKLGDSLHGRLHRSDLTWSRISQIGEMLSVGDEVEAKILAIDADKQRIHIGVKQIQPDPLEQIEKMFPVGSRLFGKVAAIKEYGAFVEIEKGIEGLVHISEMDWHNNNVNPEEIVKIGNEVEVMLLNVDLSSRRISLGMKQCTPNPWENFATAYRKGSKFKGTIQSKTDFGLFVSLPEKLSGLVHISDLSYSEAGVEALKNYHAGQEVEVILQSVDAEKRRISLGIKQLIHEDFDKYVSEHPARTLVSGEVVQIGDKAARVQLDQNVVATLPAREMAAERVRDLAEHLKIGAKIEAMIINIDPDKHHIVLSMKAKDRAVEVEQLRELRKQNREAAPKTTSFGQLLKDTLGDAAENKPAAERPVEAVAGKDEVAAGKDEVAAGKDEAAAGPDGAPASEAGDK